MLEHLGGLDSFLESFPVLDMTVVVRNSRVKDIIERVLAQELVGDDSEALGILKTDPQFPKIGNRVDCLLLLVEFS